MTNLHLLLLICVVFSTTSMIVLILMAIRRYPAFNWPIHTLSNLGNPESGIASPFLNGAYVLGGMGLLPLYIYFSIFSFQNLEWGAMVAGPFLIGMTISLIMLGFFSDHPSTIKTHLKCSIATFSFYGFGVFLVSFTWFSSPNTIIFGIFNVLLFLSMAMIWILTGTNKMPWSNQAIPEFISILIYCLTAYVHVIQIISN